MVAPGVSDGLLLAFEGIDGCGKSTQAARLVGSLGPRVAPRPVTLLREPGGTAFGEKVRELLLFGGQMGATAEMLLYMASRAELYETHVAPALARDEVVVLDRSHYSTAAYQGAGLELDEGFILELSQRVINGREPDRVLLLDIDVELAMSRCRGPTGADGDRIEARSRAYFERVHAAYGRFASQWPERFAVVDGSGSADAVAARVEAALVDVIAA
jgi:dTMP kinase